MLSTQQRLGLTVTALLLEVGTHRAAPMMPYHARWAKNNLLPMLQQSPAHVDIVSGLSEDRVEAADLTQSIGPECHVATRHMLGNLVIDQDVRWRPRTRRDASSHRAIVRRQQIRSAHSTGTRL